jgi:LacI family transcriptional regulator
VALLIETSNAYARGLLHGIRAYLSERQSWSIYLSEHSRGEILPKWLRQWKGDGVIARVENQQIADELLRLGLPTVDVSVGLQHSPFPRVATDSLAASHMAATHLIDRGFHQFAYCGDGRYHWSVMRSSFFSDFIRRAGFKCNSFDGEPRTKPLGTWEEEIEQIAAWLKRLPKPTGLMACYDIRGQQVLEACRRAGILVPDDLAVIGVHNDELLCDLCDPPLSSVIPNARRAGYEAAALLDRNPSASPHASPPMPSRSMIRRLPKPCASSGTMPARASRWMRCCGRCRCHAPCSNGAFASC